MNKKGQVLVLFVMLLPVILLLIFFVYNRVYLYGEHSKQKNLANSLCNYYKKGKSKKDIEGIAIKNDKELSIKIKDTDDTITIVLVKEVKNLLNKEDKIKTETVCK